LPSESKEVGRLRPTQKAREISEKTEAASELINVAVCGVLSDGRDVE
jgi:hypothetical protein